MAAFFSGLSAASGLGFAAFLAAGFAVGLEAFAAGFLASVFLAAGFLADVFFAVSLSDGSSDSASG